MNAFFSGSSPRMRGAPISAIVKDDPLGIIPAYAGSTRGECCKISALEDHPRVCGEHSIRLWVEYRGVGSSPRMRGAPRAAAHHPVRLRIIPAYAGSTWSEICANNLRRDHPRVCGEHHTQPDFMPSLLGSSPRMRGALALPTAFCASSGIIPAYAGSTGGKSDGIETCRGSSPRMRGARLANLALVGLRGIIPAYAGSTEEWCADIDAEWGSSPRMRGAHRVCDELRKRNGIIPAYAGSTVLLRRHITAPTDHPRVCGEHDLADDMGWAFPGSSPRMRGARRYGRGARPRARIIPAYAGSTPSRRAIWALTQDHPRVCGEHSAMERLVSTETGSSPRMRGAPTSLNSSLGSAGIIPAYAGSTGCEQARGRPHRDHPRVCGEHETMAGIGRTVTGSSPRMRGAPLHARTLVLFCWIIPAYAGSTATCGITHRVPPWIIPAYAGSTNARQRRATSGWDHPRVCGEHFGTCVSVLPKMGSSPRMRGALYLRFVADVADGIIPAYAGSTSDTILLSASKQDHPRVCGEHSEIAVSSARR